MSGRAATSPSARRFKQAFRDDELPIIALLHLFQSTVDVDALRVMGELPEFALPEMKGRSKESLIVLLDRAKDIGLLTHWQSTWYIIHPALPWFLRQLFVRHYDGQSGRSTSQAALHAWANAIAAWGDYYVKAFSRANQGVIGLLTMEEANLLHARRLSRRHRRSALMGCMQALNVLYRYQSRWAEWARLVDEIRPDYCTDDDEPIPGYEDDYSLMLQYCAQLAEQERDFTRAAVLLRKVAVFDRQQAAAELGLPANAPLSDNQRNRLRTLGVSVFNVGRILQKQLDAGCLEHYQAALGIYRRIDEKLAQATAEFDLGHAYLTIDAICDLDAAEAAYERSLHLRNIDDALGRSRCLNQLGIVQRKRLEEAIGRRDEPEVLRRYFIAAEACYFEALRLCPEDALNELRPMHTQLGNLYRTTTKLDLARDHYEIAAQYAERTGNRFEAGGVRFNMALMFMEADYSPLEKRPGLLRARAYADAALRDFQSFQGRAAKHEATAQSVLDDINRALAALPQ